MKLPKILIFSICSIPALGLTAQFTENFTSRAAMASATAIWNQGTGFVTPNLVVKGWSTGVAQPDASVDIGDGSHGAFDSSTWSNFATSVNVGTQTIYLDTTTYPIFKFTTFNLPTGWTIEPVGNNPLIIYVLGDMTVDGVIQCSGQNGSNASGSGGGAIVGAGGNGRCGGARGGDGGPVYPGAGSSAGQNGFSPHASITGGTAGTTTGTGSGSGGGGGGSWATTMGAPAVPDSTAGTSGIAGARGTAFSDPSWTLVYGSAGGGGGSGSTNEAGGGGGGGGGVVILHVGGNLTIDANGEILANGGNGGVAPGQGGGGGAGGGGSIQIWVGGALTLNGANNFWAVSADTGVYGNTASAGDGGGGYRGRTWISSGSYVSTFGATIFPNTELVAEGDVRYTTGSTLEAESQAFDSTSTTVTWDSASFTPASAAVQLEVAGSSDSFASDNSGWVSASNISQLNGKRYLKFRVLLNNTDDTNPAKVDQVSIQYKTNDAASSSEINDFKFKSSGCGVVGPTDPPGPGNFFLLLFALPLGLLLKLRFRFLQ